MGKLDIAVRLAGAVSITIGIVGVVVQARTTGLDVDSVIAGVFIGVVLTAAVVVTTMTVLRRRTRAWLAAYEVRSDQVRWQEADSDHAETYQVRWLFGDGSYQVRWLSGDGS